MGASWLKIRDPVVFCVFALRIFYIAAIKEKQEFC